MTTFTFNGPNGQQVTIDAPTRDDALRELNSRVQTPPRAVGSPGHASTYNKPAPEDFGSTGANFAAGFGQGLLNPIEGAGEMIEHIPYIGPALGSVVPQGVRDAANRFRERAESTTAGNVGEFAGNVLPFLFQPELGLARAAGTIGRVPGFLGRVFERGTLPATLEPVPQAPPPKRGAPTPDDFWKQKGWQAALGTAIGAPFEAVASGLGGIAERSGARQRAAQAAERAHAQAVAQATADHAAALTAHETGTLERAAEQAARQTAAGARREGIPNETTLRWYKETLDRIGRGADAPTAVTPEAGARVQKLVGDRLNEIIGRMQLDHGDPAFADRLTAIRDDVMRELPESAQTRFYKPPPERDLASPIIDPVTGKPFPRSTRVVGTEGKPTGDWVRTVMEPLAKGELKGRDLTNYISRLGARAEELARQARTVPQDQRAELLAMSNAYRQVEDAVIGHAAGSPEDKLALEQARKAYSMWSIGNDAGRASQGGRMTPEQLIRTISRRMGEARYKQALADPKHPDSDLYNWVQRQQERVRADLPTVRPSSAVPPRPGRLRTPPPPTPPPQPGPGLGQHAADAMAHWLAWHVPGPGHLGYWGIRRMIPALTRRAGPAISRGAGRISRGIRRSEAPVSAGTADVAREAQEPAMKFEWPK